MATARDLSLIKWGYIFSEYDSQSIIITHIKNLDQMENVCLPSGEQKWQYLLDLN